MREEPRRRAGAVLRAGIPDDDNRHYLPEHLKGTSIVVNENGNNSQPYPSRLERRSGAIVDAAMNTWYVYVPESYDPSVASPLVVSLHGGLMTGWGQAVYSSWTNVADREGFVVVFPDAASRRFWTIDIAPGRIAEMTAPNPEGLYLNPPPRDPSANHDISLIRGVIDWASVEYAIDAERVFLHGMSMGEAMTSTFVRRFGYLLAGAAGSGAPIDADLLFDDRGGVVNTGGPLPMWQSRLDLDEGPQSFATQGAELVRQNRDYWLRVNEIDDPPAISILGVDNFAFYSGGRADVVFRDVHGRDHGQTFDDAEFVWDYFFSGLRRRTDGSIASTPPELARTGDALALAVADGRPLAWVHGERVVLPTPAFIWEAAQYHGRGGARVVRKRLVYVPLSFLASVLGGHLTTGEEGSVAVLELPDGRVLQFARGVIGCVLDGRVRSMSAEAVLRDGHLCVSFEWFTAAVLDLHVSEHSGVVYATDHFAQLSANMAFLLADLLDGVTT
ncbi:hypothetical protein SK224_05135 [Microbacterium sp. BG28]|uniref:alpha/beta hydrolase family esterase n=1 Tax=Microbacterium sp. BG28 TaxID=3097356 RepID=UPI002A5AE8C2|nr:hypothetical protein [Microbacterium sp. BG28]MDY0828508.1 hypothetical protein [Microbacterium sp. BG28]